MDPYISEHWILERHAAVIRKAELLARLLPTKTRPVRFTTWVAWRLRGLADRLDGQGRLEKAAQ